MNILPLSDLHLDWHRDGGDCFIESLDPTGVDVLVLAGDIHDAMFLKDVLAKLSVKFPQVVLTAGNHEFYGYSPEQTKGHIHHATKLPNVHWLNQSTVTIDGVRFVGATLWFPKPSPGTPIWNYNDFHQIKGITPWVFDEHRTTLDFLRAELRSDDVLVTHFMPLRESIRLEYAGHPLNCFFWSGEDADRIVREKTPRLVIHGHTHLSLDYQLGNSRVVCNPFGYCRVEENAKFDERLIVTV